MHPPPLPINPPCHPTLPSPRRLPPQLYADKTALTNILSYHVIANQVGARAGSQGVAQSRCVPASQGGGVRAPPAVPSLLINQPGTLCDHQSPTPSTDPFVYCRWNPFHLLPPPAGAQGGRPEGWHGADYGVAAEDQGRRRQGARAAATWCHLVPPGWAWPACRWHQVAAHVLRSRRDSHPPSRRHALTKLLSARPRLRARCSRAPLRRPRSSRPTWSPARCGLHTQHIACLQAFNASMANSTALQCVVSEALQPLAPAHAPLQSVVHVIDTVLLPPPKPSRK